MTSVALLYINECKINSVKVNSKVIADLKNSGETADNMKCWDLRNTMIGTKGAIVVMNIVKEHLQQLESINFSGSNIQSPFMKVLLATAVEHPKLKAINLSDNDIRLGGSELIELVKKNQNIIEVNVANTHLRTLFIRLLENQLKKNAAEYKSDDSFRNDNIMNEESDPFASDGDSLGESKNTVSNPFCENGDDDGDRSSLNGTKTVGFEDIVCVEKHCGINRRATVCSEVYGDEQIDNFKAPVYEKSEEELAWIISILEKHELFSHLEDHELTVTANAMFNSQREEGSVLFEEGDEDNSDMWYLLAEGEIELRRDGDLIRTLSKGDATDDLVLLYHQVTKVTGTCTKFSSVYVLDRETYRFIISQTSKKKREMYEGFLSTVGFLKDAKLAKNDLLQLADSLKSVYFEDGKALIEYGEVGEAFFIILEGTVDVFGRRDGEVVKVCDFTVGDCVGELEFLNNHRCVADVKANGFVRVAKMNRRHFEMVMGPVKEILSRNAGESTVYSYYREQLEQIELGNTTLRNDSVEGLSRSQ
eukprot:Tbor_TRINITY_DN5528_c1_g1::TRINITY_DN5528_c1_g1_i1::g.13101::m.13101/K04739/PRKAR; cAMP-dependent protein kinase regulator